MSLKGFKRAFLAAITFGVVYVSYFYTEELVSMVQETFLERCDAECFEALHRDGLQKDSAYLIHTPTCDIPNIPLDHSSVIKYKLKHPSKVKCSTKAPLTEESGLQLHLYKSRINQYGYSSMSSVRCYYQGIVRMTQDPQNYDKDCDKGGKLKNKVPLTDETTAIDEDAVLVTCFGANGNINKIKNAFYKNVHYFIQPRRAQEKVKRHKENMASKEVNHRMLNVILMGTDSVSRANLIRNMPKTYDYLVNHLSAVDMKGFNKVGDNTYPNLVAMLSGMTREELKMTCLPNAVSKYDDCPFIWKNFSERGYVTAFGEDASWMGIFQYKKTGFVLEPTDYYNVPYFYVSDEYIGHYGHTFALNGKMCQGDKLSISVIHDYSLKVVRTLGDTPSFGLYWPTSTTHDNVMRASVADEPSFDYLQRLYHGGHLENTALFFLSDHGTRFGAIRTTYAGMLEERLPYMMVIMPEWFKEEYPDAYSNLRTNADRLISPFDIYSTLQDILSRSYADLSKSFTGGQHGHSLFRKVPLNRTCEDATIPPHLCTCQRTEEISLTDAHLLMSAEFTIMTLNNQLRPFSGCSPLMLDKVMKGRIGYPSRGTHPKQSSTIIRNYIAVFRTKPGGAVMESSVQYADGKYLLVGEVSRINKYGNQSYCINDSILQKYCYCKDLLVMGNSSELTGSQQNFTEDTEDRI